jgi:hypothetical protein
MTPSPSGLMTGTTRPASLPTRGPNQRVPRTASPQQGRRTSNFTKPLFSQSLQFHKASHQIKKASSTSSIPQSLSQSVYTTAHFSEGGRSSAPLLITGGMDETCPVSTERWTRRVHFVREGGGGGGQGAPPTAALCSARHPNKSSRSTAAPARSSAATAPEAPCAAPNSACSRSSVAGLAFQSQFSLYSLASDRPAGPPAPTAPGRRARCRAGAHDAGSDVQRSPAVHRLRVDQRGGAAIGIRAIGIRAIGAAREDRVQHLLRGRGR